MISRSPKKLFSADFISAICSVVGQYKIKWPLPFFSSIAFDIEDANKKALKIERLMGLEFEIIFIGGVFGRKIKKR